MPIIKLAHHDELVQIRRQIAPRARWNGQSKTWMLDEGDLDRLRATISQAGFDPARVLAVLDGRLWWAAARKHRRGFGRGGVAYEVLHAAPDEDRDGLAQWLAQEGCEFGLEVIGSLYRPEPGRHFAAHAVQTAATAAAWLEDHRRGVLGEMRSA